MSRRESAYAIVRTSFESPASPNSTVDEITVELRMFYPPNATRDDLMTALAEALINVNQQLSKASA